MTLPRFKPMLPVNQSAENNTSFAHEIKWDGFRVLAYVDKAVILESRNGHVLNKRFPQVVNALEIISEEVVIDGEVVALTEEGHPEFSLLQHALDPATRIFYIVFDLLFWQGESICAWPWSERRGLLEKLIANSGVVVISPLLSGDASFSLAYAKKHNLEGIVSKDKSSPYLPGSRSSLWRKQKINKSLDCVVIGLNVTEKRIRSLAVALYDFSGSLHYLGNVGSGLTQTERVFLKKAIDLLQSAPYTVINLAKSAGEFIWLTPHLVAEIKYLELTPQQRLRHSVFLRFRFDKDPRTCILGVE